MRHHENHFRFRNIAFTIPLKNDKPKRIISSKVSHLSWNVLYARIQHVHWYWVATLVHGVLYIPVLKASGWGIGQKGLVPLLWIHLVLPLFWSTSGISFTGKARDRLQKDGGRKCPCCILILAQEISKQLTFWNGLKHLLRQLCQLVLFTELFLVCSGQLCWGWRLNVSSWLSWLFSSQLLYFFGRFTWL